MWLQSGICEGFQSSFYHEATLFPSVSLLFPTWKLKPSEHNFILLKGFQWFCQLLPVYNLSEENCVVILPLVDIVQCRLLKITKKSFETLSLYIFRSILPQLTKQCKTYEELKKDKRRSLLDHLRDLRTLCSAVRSRQFARMLIYSADPFLLLFFVYLSPDSAVIIQVPN